MGIQEFPQVDANATIAQLREIIAETNQLLDFVINGKLDSRNIREIAGYLVGLTEFKHKSGLVGLNGADPLDPDAIRIWAGLADMLTAPFRVQQNGYMYSTRGFIGGWDIDEDRLSGTGTIEGGTIIGSEIMTALAGVYPRSSMSSIDDLFSAEQSATEFIRMAANYLGSVALLINSSTVNGVFGPSGNDLYLSTFFSKGNIQINSGQDLLLFSNGLTKIDSWSTLYSRGDNQTLQQALNAKQSAITSGDVTVIGNTATLNAGISATKIASGVVNNTQFQYLAGVTSSIQSQLDGKRSGVVSANTSVAAYQSTLQALAIGYNKINYQTETKDNLNEWSTVNSNFTPVTNATYVISAGVRVTGVGSGIELALGVFINGTLRHLISHQKPGAAGDFGLYGCTILDLTTSQTVDIRLYSASIYNTVADQNYTYVNITRAS